MALSVMLEQAAGYMLNAKTNAGFLVVCSTSLMALLCSMKDPLDVVPVGAWKSLVFCREKVIALA